MASKECGRQERGLLDEFTARFRQSVWTAELNGIPVTFLRRPDECPFTLFPGNLEAARKNGIKPVSLTDIIEKLEEERASEYRVVFFDLPAGYTIPGNDFRLGGINQEKRTATLILCGPGGTYDYSSTVKPIEVPLDKPFFTGFTFFDYRLNGLGISLSEAVKLVGGEKSMASWPGGLTVKSARVYWADKDGKLVERTQEQEEQIRRKTRMISQVVEIKGKAFTFRCNEEELQKHRNELEAVFMADRIAKLRKQEGEFAVEEFLKKAISYFEVRGMISSIRRDARSRLQGEFMRFEGELGFPSDNEIVLKFVQDKGIAVETIDS